MDAKGGVNTGILKWTDDERTIWAGIRNNKGSFYLFDTTNNRGILESDKDGKGFARGGRKAEMRTDSEGGNFMLTGPSTTQKWKMDNWNDKQFRIYCDDKATSTEYIVHKMNYRGLIAVLGGSIDNPFLEDESNISIRAGMNGNDGWFAIRFQTSPVQVGIEFALRRVGSSSPSLQVRHLHGNTFSEWKTITNF